MMMQTEQKKVLPVAAIENGTVIDHISAGKAILLLRLLKLEQHHKQVTIGLNLPSSRMKMKDILKVEGWELSPNDVSQIAIFSPLTTLSIIQDFKVVKKYPVTLPEVICNVIICPNPQCITHVEATSRLFHVSQQRNQLRCGYCERSYYHHEIKHYVVSPC